jgi:hypothetical protein
MEKLNTLIAEFLEWKLCDCGIGKPHYKYGELNWQTVEIVNMDFHKNWNRYRYTHNKYTLKRHLIDFGYNPKYCGKTRTYYVKNLNPKHLDIIKEHYNVNINVEDDK